MRSSHLPLTDQLRQRCDASQVPEGAAKTHLVSQGDEALVYRADGVDGPQEMERS